MLLYRLLVTLFAAWVLAKLALRRDGEAFRARLGRGPGGSERPRVWLHAASNGELASARPLIEAWREARRDLPLVVTCNTATGVALAREMGLEAELAPLDLARAVDRFRARWRVVGHVAMESELWPNRILRANGPVAVLGARLSEGSARGWGRFPALARRVLGRIDFASAQDTGSRDRMRALGLRAEATGPVADLKSFYRARGTTPDPELAARFDRGRTWLAASTHPGDEEVVARAHILARAKTPGLDLILAPRHPARAEEIAALLRDAGLVVAQRSKGETPAAGAVYLADTMGEMPAWYALAGTVFIGGTLTDRGGHTPYEPAAFGAALVHGPDVRNFRASFGALNEAGAALEISDAESLAEAVMSLTDDTRREAMAAAASRALAPEAGPEALAALLLEVFAEVPGDPPGRHTSECAAPPHA